MAHFVFVAADLESLEARLYQEGADSLPASRRIGLRKYDVNAGVAAVGDPSFCTVQLVNVAALHRARLQTCGVGACARLRQAERAENFAAGEPWKIFFLLLFVAEH